MGKELEGRVAVVTGSGQGIGRAIAMGMAKEGAKVVTNNRKPGSPGRAILTDEQIEQLDSEKKEWFTKGTSAISGDAETTAQAIRDGGGEAVAFFGDITKFDVAEKLIQQAIDSYGRIDILVNVAGAFGFSPIEKMSEELWDRITTVKPKGYFNTIRHAAPHMIKQKWGRIMNCTSKAWLGDLIKHSAYCTANAGVVGLTKAAAIELHEYGITCNAFSPWAKTRASYELDTYAGVVEEKDRPFVIKRTGPTTDMTERTPGPEYIAPFLCYLASEGGAGISGSVFTLGGNGISMYCEPIHERNITKFGEGPWTMDELKQQVPRMMTGYRNPAANPV